MNLSLYLGISCLSIALAAWMPAMIRAWKRFRAPRELWMAGEYQGRTRRGLVVWELNGVFSSRELALAACTKKNHFITRLQLNQPLPGKTDECPATEYPLITGADNAVQA